MAILLVSPPVRPQVSHARYLVLLMLFVVTTVNYADRATLSIAGSDLSKQLGLSTVAMGYAFSAFGWAYVIGQIPGGWLLDRFGSKRVYAASILLWSIFTFAQGFIGLVPVTAALATLFGLRFMLGLAEAPSFPGNGRVVAAWFPTVERGTAAAIFNSAQYFSTAIFAPFTGWLTFRFGWPYVFWVMGAIGIGLGLLWLVTIYSPRQHPRISADELDHIERGGGLVDMDERGRSAPTTVASTQRNYLGQLLRNRMLVGVYVGQYCITAITYFFLTWFPVYLVQQRGLSILNAGLAASLPALCGFCGGVLGGLFSDRLLKYGWSLTVARKVPIVTGMLLSTTMILCNYIESTSLVIAVMALAFFGKGVGSLGWAVVSDTSPKQIAGLSGGLFNTFGNVAAITTHIAIGYLVQSTGSFTGALVFVAAHALAAIAAYLVVVGTIKRVELKEA